MSNNALEPFRTPVPLKLALLWASLMFLYIYNDYFTLFVPGTITHMSAGQIGPLGKISQPLMMAVSLLLSVPALMVFLSVALPPVPSRWLNLLLGVAYTAVELLTFASPWLFYKTTVGFEIVLSVLIVWYSWRWPRTT